MLKDTARMVAAELSPIQKEELLLESVGEKLRRAHSLGPLTEPEQNEVLRIAAQAADDRAKTGEKTYPARAKWDMDGAACQVVLARLDHKP